MTLFHWKVLKLSILALKRDMSSCTNLTMRALYYAVMYKLTIAGSYTT